MNEKKVKTRKTIPKMLVILLVLAGIAYTVYINAKGGFQKPEEHRKTRFYMDTYVQVVIADTNIDQARLSKAFDEAFGQFERLEKKFNFHSSESQLNAVNTMLSNKIEDGDLLFVITKGIEMAEKTDGAFDPTLGALKEIYPIGAKDPVPPDNKAITNALKVSGYKKVKLENNCIDKPDGLKFDLGGIIKGHAVEQAAGALDKMGIKNYMVNGGGNITAKGVNLQGKPWRIGVENPRVRGGIIAVIPLDNEAVATSGDYQRYFFYQGKRYHHIIDPKTGRPANMAISATVIAPDSLTADVISTAAFVKGRTEGIKFLEKNRMEGIILDESGHSVTKGLKGKVRVEFK